MSLRFLDCRFILQAEHGNPACLVILQFRQNGLLLVLVGRLDYHRLLEQLVLLLLNLNRITKLASNL